MAEINATMVKSLRDRTGAGMMDCKKALQESEGNEDKAVELIQKKGLAKAAKKSGAIATEGMVQSYIHPGNRIGVLVEVNCQTDFVARNEEFRSFVDEVCLQIASMAPQFVRREDIPEDAKERQREIFRGQLAEEEQRTGKKRPPEAVDKILDGKLSKWMGETCLMEQPSIRESGDSLEKIANELTARLGEKISIRRFVRYELGEGVEAVKKDLASEVADTLKGS